MDVDEYIKNTLEAIGAGLGALFLVIFRKFMLAVVTKFLEWIKGKLVRAPQEEVGLIDIQDFLELRDQCVIAMDRMGADRISIFQFHNGDHFTSAQPNYKLSCSFEVPKAGIGSVMDLVQQIPIFKLMEAPLTPVFSKTRKLPGIHQIDCSKICPNKGDTDRCKADLFGVYWVIASQLPEGFWKTYMVGNNIMASVISPLRNDSELIVGFVSADFIDDRYNKEESFPKQSYLLCFLSRNGWDFLSRMCKPPPGPPRRRSGGYRPPRLPV